MKMGMLFCLFHRDKRVEEMNFVHFSISTFLNFLNFRIAGIFLTDSLINQILAFQTDLILTKKGDKIETSPFGDKH